MHMLERYIQNTREIGQHLERAFDEHNLGEVRAACSVLEQGARAGGCQPLADAAADVLAALERSDPLDDTLKRVRVVARLCRRLARP
jgi:hypothetical protein